MAFTVVWNLPAMAESVSPDLTVYVLTDDAGAAEAGTEPVGTRADGATVALSLGVAPDPAEGAATGAPDPEGAEDAVSARLAPAAAPRLGPPEAALPTPDPFGLTRATKRMTKARTINPTSTACPPALDGTANGLPREAA